MRPKALVVGGLLGLGFWVGVFAAIDRFGIVTLIEVIGGAALGLWFARLVHLAWRAAQGQQPSPVAPENDYALRERYNRAQRERRVS